MKPMTEELLKQAGNEVDDYGVFTQDQITYLQNMIFKIRQAIENEVS